MRTKRCFIYRHGRFSCIDPRDRAATKKFGGYRLLYPPPAPLGLGLHSAENLQSARHFHENGSDRDDVEGGRELGWFPGVRTIIFDGLRGLLRLLELTLAISPARDRTSLSAGPSADDRNPNRKRGVGGPEICLGMGSYRSLAAEWLAVAGARRYLPNNHL